MGWPAKGIPSEPRNLGQASFRRLSGKLETGRGKGLREVVAKWPRPWRQTSARRFLSRSALGRPHSRPHPAFGGLHASAFHETQRHLVIPSLHLRRRQRMDSSHGRQGNLPTIRGMELSAKRNGLSKGLGRSQSGKVGKLEHEILVGRPSLLGGDHEPRSSRGSGRRDTIVDGRHRSGPRRSGATRAPRRDCRDPGADLRPQRSPHRCRRPSQAIRQGNERGYRRMGKGKGHRCPSKDA